MRLVVYWVLSLLLLSSSATAFHVDGSLVVDHEPDTIDYCSVYDGNIGGIRAITDSQVHLSLISPAQEGESEGQRMDFTTCSAQTLPCTANTPCVSGSAEEQLTQLRILTQQHYLTLEGDGQEPACKLEELPCTEEGEWQIWFHTFNDAGFTNFPQFDCTTGDMLTDSADNPLPGASQRPFLEILKVNVNYEDEEWCDTRCTNKDVEWREEAGACCGDDIGAAIADSESDCGAVSGTGICANTNLGDDQEFRWIVPGEDVGIVKDVQCANGQLKTVASEGLVFTCGRKGSNNFLTQMIDLPNTDPHGFLCKEMVDFSNTNDIQLKAEIIECAGSSATDAVNANAATSQSEPELVGLPFCTAPDTPIGDVNGDGRHTDEDARIARWMLDNNALPADLCCVDINQDGTFNSDDIEQSSGDVNPGDESSIEDIVDSTRPASSYRSCSNIKNRVGKMYYCTRDGEWRLDLDDLPGRNCEDAGEIGNANRKETYTGSLCCSEENDFPEFYNEPLPSDFDDMGGCWESTFVGDAQTVDIHSEQLVQPLGAEHPVINIGGTFYGCNLEQGDVRLALTDTHTQEQLVQNKLTCETVVAAGATAFEFVCEFDGNWKRVNRQQNPAQADAVLGENPFATLKEALPGVNLAINPDFTERKTNE